MNKQSLDATAYNRTSGHSFDELMAKLHVQITHHSLTQCEASIPCIVTILNALCEHPEMDLFPSQQQVLLKMRHLWKTRLFQVKTNTTIH